MEELEALHLAANNAVEALNARGDLLETSPGCPVRVGEIALHGV
jgi:hypothetical protein